MEQESSMTDAEELVFEFGKSARECGQALSDNPYTGTMHFLWRKGWSEMNRNLLKLDEE